MNTTAQAIRKISLELLGKTERDIAALKDAPRFDSLARARVTAVRTSGGSTIVGYQVTLINDDGTTSARTYDYVNPFPGAAAYAENDIVLLWFPREGHLPFILATGGGGGGGGGVTTVAAYENYLSFLADS